MIIVGEEVCCLPYLGLSLRVLMPGEGNAGFPGIGGRWPVSNIAMECGWKGIEGLRSVDGTAVRGALGDIKGIAGK